MSALRGQISRRVFGRGGDPLQFIEPVGQLSDSKAESYDLRVTVPLAKPAAATLTHAAGQLEHVVVVRAYDRYENMSSAKTVIRGK